MSAEKKKFSLERFGVSLAIGLLCLGGLAAAFLPDLFIREFDTIQDVVNRAGPSGVYRTVYVRGYHTPGDGGGGMFTITNTATGTNIGTRIYSGVSGRSWERVNPKWSVKEFGAKVDGATDDTAAANATIVAANAVGGREVSVPPGTLKANGQIVLLDGVTLVGDGPAMVTIDMTASTATGAYIKAEGTLTALPTIGGNITKGDDRVTFASAPTLASGDIYVLQDTDTYSYSGARSYYHAGEFFEVHGVNGSVVTNRNTRAYASYTTGADKSLWKLNPVRVGMRGLKVRFKTGNLVAGVKVTHGVNCAFENLDLSGSGHVNLYLDRSYNITLRNIESIDDQANNGSNYGILWGNSQICRASDLRVFSTRHGWATGGGAGNGAVVNRDIIISDSHIGSTTGGSQGLDFHGNAEHYKVDNCVLPNGIDFGGNHGTIVNCTIRNNVDGGHAIYGHTEMTGSDFKLEGNTIYAEKNFEGGQSSLCSIYIGAYNQGGNFQFNNNKIYAYGFHAGLDNGFDLQIKRYVEGGSADVNIEVCDNEFHSDLSFAVTKNRWAIFIQPTATTGFNRVKVSRNVVHRGGVGAYANILNGTIENNHVFDSLTYGISIFGVTAPSQVGTWHLKNNKVKGALLAGLHAQLNTGDTLFAADNWSINNGVDTTASTVSRSSLYIPAAGTVWLERNFFGDTAAAPTQSFITRLQSITTLYRGDNRNVGAGVNSLADAFISVTTNQMIGPGAGGVVSKTAAYTASTYDDTILCDTTTVGFTVILPPATLAKGKRLTIKKVSADANTLTIDASGTETIDGALTKTTATQWETFRLQCDGTQWLLM